MLNDESVVVATGLTYEEAFGRPDPAKSLEAIKAEADYERDIRDPDKADLFRDSEKMRLYPVFDRDGKKIFVTIPKD